MAEGERTDIGPCLLNRGIRWASATLRLQEEHRYPLKRGWVGLKAAVDALKKGTFLTKTVPSADHSTAANPAPQSTSTL